MKYFIIHQIWMQGEENIPDHLKLFCEKTKNINQDWYYTFWDEEKIKKLVHQYPEYIKAYTQFQYMHQQIDFAKYLILYHHGGFYLDMDAYAVQNLTSLIDTYSSYDMLVSELNCNQYENYLHCSRRTCINNGVIYAKKHALILKNILTHICRHWRCDPRVSKFICIDQTTGPQMFTDLVIKEQSVKILKPEYLEPCFGNTCNITKNTYVIHQHHVTWLDSSLKPIFIYYMDHKQALIVFLIVFAIFIFFIILIVFFMKWRPEFFEKI